MKQLRPHQQMPGCGESHSSEPHAHVRPREPGTDGQFVRAPTQLGTPEGQTNRTVFPGREVGAEGARYERFGTGRNRSTNGINHAFTPGETIHTECSHKYTLEGFAALAKRAGWQTERTWCDAKPWFSLHLLTPA